MSSKRWSIPGGLALFAIAATLDLSPREAVAQAPSPVIGKPASSQSAQAAHDPIAAAAHGVLDRHCARCHQAGRLDRAEPDAAFGNVLRFDELAELPHLVAPGNPDGSRLYQMMLKRQMPPDAFKEGAQHPAPTSEEVAAVRAWISGLPPRAACADPSRTGFPDQAATLARLLAAPSDDLRRSRFVTIAHLQNGCVRAGAFPAYQHAVVRLFNGVSRTSAPVAVTALDRERTFFKIDLDQLGWTAAGWERIMQAGGDPLGLLPALAPDVAKAFGTSAPVARADWLAAALLATPALADAPERPGAAAAYLRGLRPAARGASAVEPASAPKSGADDNVANREAVSERLLRLGIDPDLRLNGVEPVVALADAYVRPLDAVRVAAEAGVALEAIAKLAEAGDTMIPVLARRLMQGVVSRAEIESRARELAAALGRSGSRASESDLRASASPAGPADFKAVDPGPGLILYSDKARYRPGDMLNLVVRAAADCHVTLISVDQQGRGTVIFPNDFQVNGRLAAGQELRLPGPEAPYALRLKDAGRETVVALCSEGGTMPDGIRHDFERQRFTELGDYATFLAQNAFPETVKADAAGGRRPEPRQVKARRRGKPEPVEDRTPPDRISRTGIRIVIE